MSESPSSMSRPALDLLHSPDVMSQPATAP
jgi:hypothetical protein